MSQSLAHQLMAKIVQCGPIPFVDFMQQALYAPGLGYYSSGLAKWGEAGDFITAPELSPLFSHCLARQCQQVLSSLSAPIILELGAGSGVMAVDLLLMLEQLNALPKAYWILELSAELQSRQRVLFEKRAPHLLPYVQWLTKWPKNPFKGVVIANEVLDAMPVNKFRMRNTLEEAYVDVAENQFMWHWMQPSTTLEKAVHQLGVKLARGYESEINLWINSWIKSISGCLLQGLVLLIDYGFPCREYYHPDRSMGTIMCHYQHRAHADPLVAVGLQDITAHVDFTAVAKAAVECGFEVEGYTHQGAFLIDCGIIDSLKNISDSMDRLNKNNQVKRLILPSDMGELFKVIALTKKFDKDLLGFRTFNQLEKL